MLQKGQRSTNILITTIICLVCNVTEGAEILTLGEGRDTNYLQVKQQYHMPGLVMTERQRYYFKGILSGNRILICLKGQRWLVLSGTTIAEGRDTNLRALTFLSGTTILICLVCRVTEGAEILTLEQQSNKGYRRGRDTNLRAEILTCKLTILSGTTILICLVCNVTERAEILTCKSGTTILNTDGAEILTILSGTTILICLAGAEILTYTANTTINATKTQDDHMSWLKTTLYVVIGCTVSVVFFISVIVVAVFRIRMKRNTVRRTYGSERSGRGQRDSGHDPVNYQAEDPFLNMAPSANYGNIIVNVNNGIQYVPGAEFAEFTAIMEAPPSYSDVEQEIFDTQNISPPDYSTIDRNPLRVNSVINVTPTRNQRPNSGQTPVNRRDRSNQPVDSRPRTQNAAVQTLTHRSHGRPQSGTDSLPRQPTINVQGGQILLTNISDNSQPTQVSDNEQVSSERPSSALLQVQNGQIMFGNLNTTDQSASTDIESSVPVDESQDNNPRTNIQVCEGQIVLASENTPAVITENPTVNESPSRRQLDVCEGQIVLK
ncbi:unnamed protein product [Mytilus edulis]|uniref:Uncharacterized protein n=1 Tax=Mytilus edulis TaxID=6550 RepID=A0A8S3PR74_MYTED|nr:unnamed protein product [Mytilus edulis]